MTTNEWVAVFVGIVTVITTVAGGFLRSGRAARLRKAITEDQAIVAAIVLHPMRARSVVYAFLAFLFWAFTLCLSGVRRTARDRARERDRILDQERLPPHPATEEAP